MIYEQLFLFRSGLYSQRLQQSGSGAGSCRWMVPRSRSVLQEQTVEVMEAVVWRCSSGGPWRSSGGARREVRGGRLEALAAGGGKAGSRAAQGRQNEGLRRRSWRRRWPGGPGGVQPGRGGMEGQVAAPHPKGVLEGPAAASWRARRRRPGGPGGGVLEGPAAASWRARRGRPGGPGGGGGGLEGPAAAAPHPVKLNSSPVHHERRGMSGVQIELSHFRRNEATLRRSRRSARWRSWRRRSRRWRSWRRRSRRWRSRRSARRRSWRRRSRRWRSWRRRSRRWTTAGGSGGGGPEAARD
ncbi:unnamed protein product [Gadus morhua 'NCC']